MGSWTIYSVGDAAFLEQILISVAMLTGTNDFTRAASIGLLFALIFLGFQSLMTGAKEFNIHQVFVSWIAFSILFVPSTTVVIEDNVSGSVRVVDNVPFGVGAAGGIISTIGYKMTAMYEQGYGYIAPYITETHFADSLNLLNKVRTATQDPKLLVAISQSQGGDIRGSWDNYIRECTLTKIDLGEANVDDVMGGQLPNSLMFASTLFGTQIHVDHTGPRNVTCYEGFYQLEAATRSGIASPYFEMALSQSLGRSNPDNPSLQSSYLEVTDALQALRFTQNGAQDYVYASIMMPIYQQAVEGKYQDLQDISSAIMVNQAIQQRNTQWAAEQSMFMSVVRPMQTFFEGFIYAITPLLAVLMIMGNYGMMLIFKYVQTIFWIQLWLPLLSVVNLYISTAAAGEMSAYDIPGAGVSMYSLAGINDILQTWIATGGMLAAAVPMISLFVVTGSTYAMTSIAGKIGGADHINERIPTPDLASPSPFMQQQSAVTNNPLAGTMATGAESMVTTTSIGSMLSSGIKSASDRQSNASQQFSQDLGRTISSSTQSAQSSRVMQGISDNVASIGSQQTNLINSMADQYSKKNNWSAEQRSAFVSSLTATAGANGSVGNGSVSASAGISGAGSAQDTGSVASSVNEAFDTMKKKGWDVSDSQSLNTQLAHSLSTESGSSWMHAVGDDATKALRQSSSELLSASESFSKFDEMRNTLGSQSNTSLRTVAGVMASGQTQGAKDALSQLNSFYATGMANSEMQNSALKREDLLRSLGMPQKEAQIVSRLEAMSNNSNGNDGVGAQAAASIVGTAVGMNTPAVAADRNSGLQHPSFGSGQVMGAVQSATAVAGGLGVGDHWTSGAEAYTTANDRYGEQTSLQRPDFHGGRDLVEGHHANRTNALDERSVAALNASRQEANQKFAQAIQRGDETAHITNWQSLGSKFSNMAERTSDFWADAGGALGQQLGLSGENRTDRMQTRFSDISTRMEAQGLTAAQSQLFAHSVMSRAFGASYDNGGIARAEQAVVAENPALGSDIVSRIHDAAAAGQNTGIAYLQNVVGFNETSKPVELNR